MLEAVKHTLLLAGVRTVDLSGNLGGKNRRLHFSRCLAAAAKNIPRFCNEDKANNKDLDDLAVASYETHI